MSTFSLSVTLMYSIFFNVYVLIYSLLAVLGLHFCRDFSLLQQARATLVTLHRLLLAVASLFGDHGSRASVVVAHRLSHSSSHATFSNQGSNLCLLH